MINNISDSALRVLGNLRPEARNLPEPLRGPAQDDAGIELPSELPVNNGALSGAINHMVQQGMPIDLKHIIAVKNAIADGQYPVNPALIAEKIVQLETPGGNL